MCNTLRIRSRAAILHLDLPPPYESDSGNESETVTGPEEGPGSGGKEGRREYLDRVNYRSCEDSSNTRSRSDHTAILQMLAECWGWWFRDEWLYSASKRLRAERGIILQGDMCCGRPKEESPTQFWQGAW